MNAALHDPFGLNPRDVVTVNLAAVVRRETWQVRQALIPGAVKRYAAIYKTGGAMEPVQLARIGEALVLIDGTHRIEARQRLGLMDVEAIITVMSETQAQWAAASANLTHGEGLKVKELRAVFGHYVQTGQHRSGQRKVKSLRDIVRDIPGVASHVSIGKWMKADFPEVYAKHYASKGGDAFVIPEKGLPKPSQRALDFAAIDGHLQQVAALSKTMRGGGDRQAIIERTRAMLEAITRQSFPRIGDTIRAACWT